MSYNPMIKIETETGEWILSHNFSSGGYLEDKMFEVTSSLCRQGLASPTNESSGGYPTVVKVHKATDSVKEIMLPVIEEILSPKHTLFHVWRTLKEREALEKYKHKMNVQLEALKSFPDDEGFIITAWGTL